MKKFMSIMLPAAMAGLMLLTACSRSTQPAAAQPVIDFYHGYYQNESEWPVAAEMRKIYQEFADAHKDEFTFNAVALDTGSEGVYNQAIQNIASGKFYDIADMAGWNIVPAASAQGLLLDLKPYLDADPDFKAGAGICYDQNLTGGKIYSVREQIEAVGFWYNAELFAKAGADTPDKWNTRDDFAAAVTKLKASPDVKTPFALNQGWPTNLLFSQILMGTREGREMLDKPITTFDNAVFKDALQFINDKVLRQIDTAYFTGGGENDEQYRTMFIDGEAAMLFNGVWEAGEFEDDKFRPAVFPAVDSGKKVALLSAGTGLVINGGMDEAKTAACVEFVKYLTSKPIAERVLKLSIGMPPSTAPDYGALKADTSLSTTTRKLIAACELLEAADYQGLTIGARWDMDIEGAIGGKYAGLKDGSKTPDSVIAELNQVLASN